MIKVEPDNNDIDAEYEDVDQVGEIEKTDGDESNINEQMRIEEEHYNSQISVIRFDSSNVDNEDSLNLTIGEEDEKLLHGDDHHDINMKNVKGLC